MATARSGVSTWFTRTASTDMSHVDMTTLSNGRIAVAFGGGTAGSATLHSALLSSTFTTLGTLNAQSYAPASGQMTLLRSLELDARAGGGFISTFGVNNSAIGPDGNFGGLIQQHAPGGAASGPARILDSAALGNNILDNIATVALANGRTVVFTASGRDTVTADAGIRMDFYGTDGARSGPTKTVVASTDVEITLLAPQESAPQILGAVQMANGNLAITYRVLVEVANPLFPTFTSGEQRIVVQEIDDATGARVGGPVQIAGPSGVDAEIVELSNGRLLVVWQDFTTEAVRLKAQILSANGDTKLASAFYVSAYQTGSEALGDVVALENGGFAVSWFNGFNHHLARMFTATGVGAGHDFLLTSNGANFAIPAAGELAVSGNNLVAMTTGILNGQSVQKMFGQVWSTASTQGVTRNGTASGETLGGGVKDDRLTGLGGTDRLNGQDGNDILLGGAAADTLSGGAGRDVLVGGTGVDVLTGGTGADVFVFNAKNEGTDRITDFSRAQGDRLAIDNMGFATDFFGTVLPLTIANVSNDTTADESGFHFNTRTKLLSFDVDGASGTQARVNIAVLNGVTSLQHSDFLIF